MLINRKLSFEHKEALAYSTALALLGPVVLAQHQGGVLNIGPPATLAGLLAESAA